MVSAAYFLLLKAWAAVFGASELSLRAPSLLASAAAARGVYLLGARLAGREAGVLAALVFAVSGAAVGHACEARAYAAASAYAGRAAARLGAPVALHSPYIESMSAGAPADAEAAAFLSAPLACYPAGPGPVLLPLNLSGRNRAAAAETLKAAARGRGGLVLISLGGTATKLSRGRCWPAKAWN